MEPIKKVGIYGGSLLAIMLIVLVSLVPSAEAATRVDDQVNPGCDPEYASILRLYESFFGRSPEPGGANFWISEYASGRRDLANITREFAVSPEFFRLYGAMTNDDFVTHVYRNVFEREPDLGGYRYWLDRLNNRGLSRQRFIEYISDSPEFRESHPYEASAFCEAADLDGFTSTNAFPGTVHAVSADGNVNVAFLEGGALTVSPGSALARPGDYGGTVAVNGNWFNSPRVFYGFSIADGQSLGYENGDARHAWIGADYDGNFRFAHTNGQIPVPGDIEHAVTGKLIVANGERFALSTTGSNDPTMVNRAPRTAAGITAEGFLVMVVVDGRGYGPGMTSTELADFMVSIGVHNGVMLDGGGSSAMYVDGEGIVNDPSDGRTRLVRNQLIFTAASSWV